MFDSPDWEINLGMSPQPIIMCSPLSSACLLRAHILLCSLLAVSSVDSGLWFLDVVFWKKEKTKFTHVCSFPPDLCHCLFLCH